jgi:hypothetical protein
MMNATEAGAGIPSEVDAELQEAIRRAMSGVRDPEEMRKACERMDRMREEVRQRKGIIDIAVPAIRELRGELPDASSTSSIRR